MNQLSSYLATVAPFAHIPREEVEKIALVSQVVHHAKGDILYGEGEDADAYWVLQTGKAFILKYQADGKPLVIDTVSAGNLLIMMDQLGSKLTVYPCSAVAWSDTTTVRIPHRYFESAFANYPSMVANVFEICSRQLSRLRERVIVYQEPVRKRVARTLFDLQRKEGMVLPYTSRRDISTLAATSVETTIRVIRDFQKKHWISSVGGCLRLQDILHLRALINDKKQLQDSSATLSH